LKPRVVITGGSGLLGLNWASCIRDDFEAILGLNERSASLPGTTSFRFDWSNRSEWSKQLEAMSPALVVHTAGLTNVELCEADPKKAQALNTDLAAQVAEYCGKKKAGLIHISTDHLFDGSAPLVREEHPLCPLNVYGRTKAEGETAVLQACPEALVVRTNFYGWGPPYRRSFSDWIIDSLRAGREIGVFEDVFYTPILAAKLVSSAMELWSKGVHGVIHLAGPERISKHEFAVRVASEFDLDHRLIRRAQLANSPQLVQRPFDMSLSSDKAWAMLSSHPGTLDEHIKMLAREQESGLTSTL